VRESRTLQAERYTVERVGCKRADMYDWALPMTVKWTLFVLNNAGLDWQPM